MEMATTKLAQKLVDAKEDGAAARYAKQREFAELVRQAVNRADAMNRLELTLRYGSVQLDREIA